MAHQLRFGLLSLPMFALLIGCPDSEARFNEFLDNTKDDRMDATDEESDSGTTEDTGATEDTGPEGLEDISGVYLLALETQLGPDAPLQFITTIDMTLAADAQSATATFTFLPLSLMVGSTLEPRECLADDTLVFNDVAFDADGNFTLDMGLVMVSGMANPITGSDIAATLVIEGHIVHADAMCGEITGMLMSPLEYDLAGSTFGMLRLADDGCNPATLPTMFPYRCNQVPPAPDGGGDTTTDTGTDTGTDSTT